jgi:hypothetical protein
LYLAWSAWTAAPCPLSLTLAILYFISSDTKISCRSYPSRHILTGELIHQLLLLFEIFMCILKFSLSGSTNNFRRKFLKYKTDITLAPPRVDD